MGKIITEDKEIEVAKGEEIKGACEDLGVPFSCEDGVCGTCMIEVEEGMENLSEYSEAEKNMGMEGKFRLSCQCKMKKDGDVRINTF